jgi:hypothetical protein
MKKIAALAALGSLSLTGLSCQEAELPVIANVYDPCDVLVLEVQDATPARLAAVEAAATMWNERAGSLLTLQDLADAPRIPVEFDQAAAAFRGLYDDVNPRVYVNTKLVGRDLVITLAHELGHVFGLYHVDKAARPSVMNHGNLLHEVNAGDVDELVALWGECPIDDEAPESVGRR